MKTIKDLPKHTRPAKNCGRRARLPLPEPPCDTLLYIRHLLAPHGQFFPSVPSRLCRHDPGHFWTLLPEEWEQAFCASGFCIARRRMSRLCWYGLPTPLPLTMVYELHPRVSMA